MTEMECRQELDRLKYRMKLLDGLFAKSPRLSWWVNENAKTVTRFVAVAEAWTALKGDEGGN